MSEESTFALTPYIHFGPDMEFRTQDTFEQAPKSVVDYIYSLHSYGTKLSKYSWKAPQYNMISKGFAHKCIQQIFILDPYDVNSVDFNRIKTYYIII